MFCAIIEKDGPRQMDAYVARYPLRYRFLARSDGDKVLSANSFLKP